MASIFDVMESLQSMALDATAGLPNQAVNVAQGWPGPDDVDKAMGANQTLVTIFPVQSTTSDPGQPMNWEPQVVSRGQPGTTATQTASGFALNGFPVVGEYVTIILNDRETFTATAVAGDLAQGLLANLAYQIGSRATRNDASLAFTGVHTLEVRVGMPGVLGDRLHRQRQQVRTIVWAPAPADRAAAASAIEVALKRNMVFTFPDTSSGLLAFQTLNLDDRHEINGCYRADIMWSVTWDTVDRMPGYEVTSVSATFSNGASALPRVA